jgi:hypothetical protein
MYEQTVEACLRHESSQWEIGDALLKECGPPGENGANNGSTAKLKEALEELDRNGLCYSLSTLRHMRDMSHAWPVPRGTRVSWSVYREFTPYPKLLKERLKNNPDLLMTVAEANKIVTNYKKRYDQPEQPEPVEATGEDETITNPVEDTQFVPDEPATPPIIVPPEESPKAKWRALADEAYSQMASLIAEVERAKINDEPLFDSETNDAVTKVRELCNEYLKKARQTTKKDKPTLTVVVSEQQASA